MSRRTQRACRYVDHRVISIVSALLLFAATQLATAQTGRLRFPGRLDSYLTNAVKLSTATTPYHGRTGDEDAGSR